ncbi:MAG: hypothetical protein HYZ85_00285 [Candidatus Omnitrophica bacterium]|nr:hypothetical protein [Candidatus Omnitrophota bacterium]
MKKMTFFFLLAGLLFYGPQTAAAEDPWQLKMDRDGIKVYTRKVQGSPVLEFLAETQNNAPLEKATGLYEQVDRMTQWFHRSKDVLLLQENSKDEVLIYFAADLPWPLSDRDGVCRRVKSLDPADGSVIYKINSAGDLYPRQKGRVRVPYINAEWHFTPLPEGGTSISYRMHTSIGGFIPPALVNNFTLSLPFKTLQKFRALLES